jgi:hypothetical protein
LPLAGAVWQGRKVMQSGYIFAYYQQCDMIRPESAIHSIQKETIDNIYHLSAIEFILKNQSARRACRK